jgi:hypothetical protein
MDNKVQIGGWSLGYRGFSEEIRFKKNGMPQSIVTESKVIDLWVHGF